MEQRCLWLKKLNFSGVKTSVTPLDTISKLLHFGCFDFGSEVFPFHDIPSTLYRIYDLQKVHPLINDTWVIHGLSYVLKMLQKIIAVVWPMKEESQYLTWTILTSQNLTVMSIWQVWVIWFKLSSKQTDRNLDLLTSLTNLSLKYGAKPPLTKYLIISAPMWLRFEILLSGN